ncbi:hypothetical protein M1D80_11795 [Phyllobacteriaceae bacterium JZ32]
MMEGFTPDRAPRPSIFLHDPVSSDSFSVAPTSWADAWTDLAAATDETQRVIENSIGDIAAQQDAYDRRIAAIHEATGVQLHSPMRSAWPDQAELQGMNGSENLYEYRKRTFDRELQDLAEKYPQHANVILGKGSIREDRNQILRDAKTNFDIAVQNPSLGPVGRFSAVIAGGLRGAARDPLQWGMAILGGGAGFGKTVAARIGTAIAGEAAINAGGEIVLQALSQARKEEAGLEHGFDDAARSVLFAGLFGAAFGGTVQGLGEVAPALKSALGSIFKSEADTAALKRVLEGAPEPGDVETIAAAAGRTLTPDEIETLRRAFDDDVLDNAVLRTDATPEEVQVAEAALRFAQDPDNNLPPEVIERMIADGLEGDISGLGSMSAEDYARLYDMEPAAMLDELEARYTVDPAGTLDNPADRSVAASLPANERLTAPDDPLVGQQLRPQNPVEPLDDAALRDAEAVAGELTDPRVDGNGNPESLFAYLPVLDGDGNVRLVPPREAIELADEGNYLADVLEACKL